MRRLILCLAALCVLGAFALSLMAPHLLPSRIAAPLGLRADIDDIRAATLPRLRAALAPRGLAPGAPVYIRIFKEERELELWLSDGAQQHLLRTYPICNYSGDLGPKLREGDRQSPEGFYEVSRAALNPNSRFHLSFNLGFPNAYDQTHARTGSFLMVHGACVSVGCYAMTDPAIEEIYLLVEAALVDGQPSVPVHAFPFRMTPARMQAAQGTQWFDFWQMLEPAYRLFEQTRAVPQISVQHGAYRVGAGT